MDRIWLNEYPPGVGAEIDTGDYASVVDIFEHSVERFRHRPAFANYATTLTYAELDSLSGHFSTYLVRKLGIGKGDRVAIMAPNILQYPIALFGILRAGAIVVNVNPLYTPRELEHQLNDAGVQAMIIFASAIPTLVEVIDRTDVRHVIVAQMHDIADWSAQAPPSGIESGPPGHIRFVDVLLEGAELPPIDRVPLTGDDVAMLQYTGGTTGVSKGATLSHGNLVANIMQYAMWMSQRQRPGEEIILSALPLYHIFALNVNCLSVVHMGALSVLITDPRDLDGLVASFRQWPYTMMSGVNTLYNGLSHTPGIEEIDFSLKLSVAGGAALQQTVADRWLDLTGCAILEGYGLSETSPILTMSPGSSPLVTSTIGVPVPSTDISLRDDEGREVATGEAGELCARGPQVMRGYWNRPEATAEVMTDDGYFRTGDIATVDERGYFRIVDRKKDMILVSGFNVYPNEVEEVVSACEGVLENACIGVPDEKSGEYVKVFAVLRPGAEVSPDAIRDHCRHHLTAYKVPRVVEIVGELPKSNVGKILRRELRERPSDV